jgi:hypothetical protein
MTRPHRSTPRPSTNPAGAGRTAPGPHQLCHRPAHQHGAQSRPDPAARQGRAGAKARTTSCWRPASCLPKFWKPSLATMPSWSLPMRRQSNDAGRTDAPWQNAGRKSKNQARGRGRLLGCLRPIASNCPAMLLVIISGASQGAGPVPDRPGVDVFIAGRRRAGPGVDHAAAGAGLCGRHDGHPLPDLHHLAMGQICWPKLRQRF